MADFAVLREAGPFTRVEIAEPPDRRDRRVLRRHPLRRAGRDQPAPAGLLLGPGLDRRSPTCRPRRSSSSARSSPWTTRATPASAASSPARSRPRQLQGVLDSVETICTEVIDDMCEQGEVDLVEAISQPFPLLVICDMMGIPRSEFDTVLDATNVILGAGDPDMLGGRRPRSTALFEAGMHAHHAHERAGRGPAREPDRRPHLRARPQRRRRGHARPERDRAVLHPARGRRQRHHPHRDQPSACTCWRRTPTSAGSGRTTSTA